MGLDLKEIISRPEYFVQRNKLEDFYKPSQVYGYIYQITFPNGDFYIGQKKGHPEFTKNYYGSGKRVINKFKSYDIGRGYSRIEFAEGNGIQKLILDYAWDKDELDELERNYIMRARINDLYDCCMNIADGGEGRGSFNHSEETKKKIGNANKGRHFEYKERPAQKGKKWITNGIIDRLSRDCPDGWHYGRMTWNPNTEKATQTKKQHGTNVAWNKGKTWSDETKIKMAVHMIGKHIYNNGIENKYFISPPDDTWVLGQLKTRRNQND